MGLPDLFAGTYRHKNHYVDPPALYSAFGYAHDANYEGRVVVVYQALQLNGAHEGPRLAVRTFSAEHVGSTEHEPDHWNDAVDVGGIVVPRFEYLSPDFDATMLRR